MQTSTGFLLYPVAETPDPEASIGPFESGWIRWFIVAKAYNIAGGYRDIIAMFEVAPHFEVVPPSLAK